MPRGALAGVGLAGAVLAPLPAVAVGQRVTTAAATAAHLEYRVDAGYGVERLVGAALGVGAALELRPWLAVALAVHAGRLDGRTSGALDRDLGQVSLDARARVTPWLVVEGGVLARSFGTTVARQRWVALRTGAEVRFAFLGAGVHGILRGGYLPAVWVNGLDQPELAFTAASGLEYRLPVATARLLYELERYDFPRLGASERAEQLAVLRLEVAFGLRRPEPAGSP